MEQCLGNEEGKRHGASGVVFRISLQGGTYYSFSFTYLLEQQIELTVQILNWGDFSVSVTI